MHIPAAIELSDDVDATADAGSDVSLVADSDAAGDACVFRAGECRPMFLGMENCTFEPGACFYTRYESPKEDRMQVPMMPDAARPPFPTPAAPVPTPAAPLPPGAVPMTPATPPVPVPASMPTPAYPAMTSTVPAPGYGTAQPTYAGTAQPDTAGSDLSKLLPANGQGNASTVILAVLAVAGGGAAWKFYSQRSKEKHEQSMREIELRATANDQQKQKCDANASASAAAIKEVGAKVDDLARKTAEHAAAIDALNRRAAASEESSLKATKMVARADELEERMDTVERKVRRAAKDET